MGPTGRPWGQDPLAGQAWYCERCNKVLGYGAARPDTSRCPNCGARFRDSSGSSGLGGLGTMLGVGFTGLVILGGIGGVVYLIVYLSKQQKKGIKLKKRKRRLPRGDSLPEARPI
jgi:hypothetical protein